MIANQMPVRFFLVLQDGTSPGFIYDTAENKRITPPCFQDLCSLVAYLNAKGRLEEAHRLLEQVAEGGKPVSELISRIQSSFSYPDRQSN